MSLQRRTLMETRTTAPGPDVIRLAKSFFAGRPSIYAAFVEQEGPGYVTLRGQGGEEIVLAVSSEDGNTRVTGSSYMFDAQVSRFFSTLPPVATPVVSEASS
jgi:hypothetical protein